MFLAFLIEFYFIPLRKQITKKINDNKIIITIIIIIIIVIIIIKMIIIIILIMMIINLNKNQKKIKNSYKK